MDKAWKLTLICYDEEKEIDDPEDLVREMQHKGFIGRRSIRNPQKTIRCDLVVPTERVSESDAAFVFGE